MKIQEYQTQTYKLTDLESLDPITIYTRSYDSTLDTKAGLIVVTCYDKAWIHIFGSMGCQSVERFVAGCDEYYLANNLEHIPDILDFDEISKVTGECITNNFELGCNIGLVNEHFDVFDFPTKTASDAEYLLRISRAVIACMKQLKSPLD